MNPVAMTVINPGKEYWPNRGSNQRLPVLKSFMLQAELCELGVLLKKVKNIVGKKEKMLVTRRFSLTCNVFESRLKVW